MSLPQTRQILLPALILITLSSGCTTIVKPAILPIPQEAELPPVTAAELQCITAATYIKIVKREDALRQWALKLRAVIKSNNESAAKQP